MLHSIKKERGPLSVIATRDFFCEKKAGLLTLLAACTLVSEDIVAS